MTFPPAVGFRTVFLVEKFFAERQTLDVQMAEAIETALTMIWAVAIFKASV